MADSRHSDADSEVVLVLSTLAFMADFSPWLSLRDSVIPVTMGLTKHRRTVSGSCLFEGPDAPLGAMVRALRMPDIEGQVRSR